MSLTDLPGLNAALNATSASLLITGFLLIRRKRIKAHRLAMTAAFCVSVVFLISYLIYHYQVGSVPFRKEGGIRSVYFSILLTHTILAAAVPFLAAITFYRGWKGDYVRHRRIARWTFPIWLYVSITGVIVYWMLYRL